MRCELHTPNGKGPYGPSPCHRLRGHRFLRRSEFEARLRPPRLIIDHHPLYPHLLRRCFAHRVLTLNRKFVATSARKHTFSAVKKKAIVMVILACEKFDSGMCDYHAFGLIRPILALMALSHLAAVYAAFTTRSSIRGGRVQGISRRKGLLYPCFFKTGPSASATGLSIPPTVKQLSPLVSSL